MTDDDQIESRSPTQERRASLERLRAVGQTFADGIAAAFREKRPSKPSVDEEAELRPQRNADAIRVAVSNPVPSDEIFASAVTSREGSQRKEMDRLQSMLEASEARGDALQEETERLRSENSSLSATVDRSARLLDNMRLDYDRLRAESLEQAGKGSMTVAEAARLRSQVVDTERALRRMTARADDADKRFVEERKKATALERVCLGLRRRVAIAEEKAQDSKRVQDAILARELAEAQLAETKVEAERWRARSSAADVARERAEAAERSERVQRDKISSLERELESREALLKQSMHEKKRLLQNMGIYEKELEKKEMRLARLRSYIEEQRYQQRRSRRHVSADDRFARVMESDNDTELGTAASLSIEKDDTEDNDHAVSHSVYVLPHQAPRSGLNLSQPRF
ncbi:unnamed protein product [Chondrus crispus]|uniref:Uncharacterized protein n=1 Tax=Chondrus crispus TaxID=2769 RepID=R7Q918_CHOCR|nr:unnamed protein product [Chondrus crispus]CDF34997.1 unnamed protein product [Chondrus crispus]|eukprot:XP_005714816.1 unnamed protein product [Chondrus crispus]